jgi:glycosyltransferase involved in cell wall biosynthesis
MNSFPLLTIAIPTWNRANYLKVTLAQIRAQINQDNFQKLEILVCDNSSSDNTTEVVNAEISFGLNIRYERNDINIGSDANIAKCFNLSAGAYVLILGDDDLIFDGGIAQVLEAIENNNYGIICIKPYGFDYDFKTEYPGSFGKELVFTDPVKFLCKIGPLITLISSCVINKKIISNLNANNFCGGNLVQVHLVINAALKAKENLFINKYLIACKRNNSGGYSFFHVFVTSFGQVLDSFKNNGLSIKDISDIERRFLLFFYPYYLLKKLFDKSFDRLSEKIRFDIRFGGSFFYALWVAPIFLLPRKFAIFWAAVATLVGRLLNGDFIRGVYFIFNKIFPSKNSF